MMHSNLVISVLLGLLASYADGFGTPGGFHLGPQTLRDDGTKQSDGSIFDFPYNYLNTDLNKDGNKHYIGFVRLEFHLKNAGSDRSVLKQKLQKIFVNARNNNVGLILRFYYIGVGNRGDDDGSCGSGQIDPDAWRIRNDVNSITPTLEQNSDVIVGVQAGFIGDCDGEWHGTNLAPDDNQNRDNTASINAKKSIVGRLTQSGKLKVMLRYPRDIADLFPSQAGSLGIHNDCLMKYNDDDGGTFSKGALSAWKEGEPAKAREWVRSNVGGVIVGEFCQDASNVNCDNLVSYIQYNKISYINYEAFHTYTGVKQCYERVIQALRHNAGA